MAIETLPESRIPATAPNRWQQDDVWVPRGRWRKRGLLVLVAMVGLTGTAALIANSLKTEDKGPKLTHVIARGDLLVTIVEQGLLESSENTEIKCQVRGQNLVIWVIESGTNVKPGDELVRLDSLNIQEQIDERTKFAHWSRSAAERSAANVVAAELAVAEYEQGRYVADLMNLEKDLAVSESYLRSSKNMLGHAKLMKKSGYAGELEVEEKQFALAQAELDVKLKRTQIDVLQRFTQAEELQTLKGALASAKATHKANVERAMADEWRRARAEKELKHCVIRADRSGLVIHRDAAEWESAPIEEGATVHKDQVLLLMPNLDKMQVKVGIHEAVVDRVKVGLSANVTLPTKTIGGTVSRVASVTRPAGWWTGNAVKYDTLVKLPADDGLQPGMSAEVEVLVAEYKDVLMIPVAAYVETENDTCCWVKTTEGPRRRILEIGDTNGIFTVVKQGLKEGDEVVLNPFALEELHRPERPVETGAMSPKATQKDKLDKKQSAMPKPVSK